jgi:hypothetical protein
MKYDDREKNPFFKPALIATLISVIGLVSCYCGIFIGQFFFLPLSIPFAFFLSIGGLVDARKLRESFIGCVFCLVISVFAAFSFLVCLQAYLSKPICADEPIVSRSYSPEESASIESINEEIKRALGGDTVTSTAKRSS